jgi:hypothetical protein
MPIRATGPLPIQEIADEFLDTATPNTLAEYYGDGIFLSQGYYPAIPPISNRRRPNLPQFENNSISISEFYGRGRRFPVNINITRNTADYNPINDIKNVINSANVPQNVEIDVVITVSRNVTVYGTSTGQNSPAIVIPPNDETRGTGLRAADVITIVNNGFIIGAPGTGGNGGGGCNQAGADGTGGGVAVWARRALIIENNGTVAGGAPGGKGGSGGQGRQSFTCSCQTCYRTCQKQSGAQCQQGGSCNGGGGARCTQGSGKNSRQSSLQRQCRQTPQSYACNPFDCNCQTCFRYSNRGGGRGGNGASVFSNTRPAGGGAAGNPAGYETSCNPSNGSAGGLWGEGGSLYLRGTNNVTWSTIGTRLGTVS